MATETTVRVARARYGGFVATFTWNGSTNRVFFDNAIELAAELADECVDPLTIEAVIDAYEGLEWDDTYPLFQPAEAVCDYDGPEYDPRTVAFRRPEPSRLWDWLAATLRIGAVTAPWVLLMIACRFAWGLAAAWGWV
jgi:hypothetical protein